MSCRRLSVVLCVWLSMRILGMLQWPSVLVVSALVSISRWWCLLCGGFLVSMQLMLGLSAIVTDVGSAYGAAA